jgi:hypothetical protein
MAEKIYTGRDGEMRVNGSDVVKVVNFQVSSNLETLETTTLGDNVRFYTPGVVGYSGSATLLYYKDSNGAINVKALLENIYRSGTSGVSSTNTVDFVFRWNDGQDEKDLVMTAYVTSGSIGAVTGDIVRTEIAFQGTGGLGSTTDFLA